MHYDKMIIALLAVLSFVALPASQVVGHSSILAPAVIISNNTGSLTTIELTVYKGSGIVRVLGPHEVANSTVQSAITAAEYASRFLGLNYSDYNFNYTILGAGNNVSGPSGGEAMTLLAISALNGKPLLRNFTVTGTISSNGSIGLIGGAYDKANVAKSEGLSFIIVPAAGSDAFEAQLYQLIQNTFNIPLIQAANTSQAYGFAFGTVPIAGKQTSINLYTSYYTNLLPYAPISCSNQCNISDFNRLTSYTFDFANSSVATLQASPGFSNIASQLSNVLGEDAALVSKGYLYAGADQAFLTYINAFLFNSHSANESTGLQALTAVQQYCNSLAPPQMTRQNYEFVLAGELRQAWGEYYTNSSITTYNSSIETTDDVLQIMKDYAAPSNAWCNAASEMYSIARSGGGTNYTSSSALAVLASNRISRAEGFQTSVYLATAKQAYAVQNYPLAILDADYAYAISNSSTASTGYSTGQLLNFSNQMAHNATFGVWATQFSNEAEFYISESKFASNSSSASYYAQSAFSAAYLASTISPDMRAIYQNLTPGTSTLQIRPTSTVPQLNQSTNQTQVTNSTAEAILVQQTHEIFVVAVIMLVVNIVLFFALVYLVLPAHKYSKGQLKPAIGQQKRQRRNG